MDRRRVMGAETRFLPGLGRARTFAIPNYEGHMNRVIEPCRLLLCVVVVLAGTACAWAQKSSVASRVVETVDDTRTVTLKGNVHPYARAAYDQGVVSDSQPMERMLLLLQRSPAQDLALRQLLDAQQTQGSGSFHNWLTPAQFGAEFGPSDADVQAVTDWLARQGFKVASVSQGKTVIEFSGNVGQVRNAFHTEMHKFVMNNELHYANVSDPEIPEALAPVVSGVVALHNFPKHNYVKKNGQYRRNKGSNQLQPLFTYGNPAQYAIGPGDFNTIYNVPPGATGANQSIAIISQSNINTNDVVAFRAMFGIPAFSSVCTSNLPPTCQFSVIVNGVDPGIVGPDSADDEEEEADLDTEWAGGIAPAANIYLVVSQSTISNPSQISMGADLSALYAVDNNIAPIISDSYGTCEPLLLTAGNQFYNSLWAQAAAQGITVAVAAGDSGSAGCDPSTDPNAATEGVAVNGVSSTPYNVSVGGTDFDPSSKANPAYWNTTSDTLSSALKYIPETTWDNSACALAYPAPCISVDTTGYGADISAGSGGPSNCITTSVSNGNITCNKSNGLYGYAKPSFQTGLTPADSVRDIPDVSFFASNGGPISGGTGVSYVICQSDTNPQDAATPADATCNLTTPYEDFSLVGGTSVATPVFAAVMALVNQASGQRQGNGNANYVLYNLAANDANYTTSLCQSSVGQTPAATCVFNDVTKGNNSVACDAGTSNCSNSSTSGGYGVIICTTATGPACPTVDNGNPAFVSGSKYDLATGLGSINVANLLSKWTSAVRTPTVTTVSGLSGGSSSSASFSAGVTVTPSSATGNVSIIALDGSGNVLGTIGTNSGGTPFGLAGGTAQVTGLLPVGTVSVEATYGGNVTYAVSTSAPVSLPKAVAGAGYTAQTTVYFVNGSSQTSTSAQNFTYGTPYSLAIVISRSDGTSCAFGYPNTKPNNPSIPCPTGSITLLDNGAALPDFLNNGTPTNVTRLNSLGIAEDQVINLFATIGGTTPAVHNITVTYSGDSNYAAGPVSNTLKITIKQAATTTQVAAPSSISPGASVVLQAAVSPTIAGNGDAPCGSPNTGTVTFTSNGTALSGTVTYVATPGETSPNGAFCTASLTTTISALYPPPAGGPGAPWMPILAAAFSMLLFALGLRWIPETRRRAYTFAGLLVIALLVGVIAGCGGGSSSGGGSTRTITATYSGDANYTTSTGSTTIQVQ
jgi:subtilase family serine protease